MEREEQPGTVAVTEGSGNIFEDLNLPDPELLLLKADLVHQLEHAIRGRDWTQAEAAVATGLTQPQVSRLARGEAMGFSIDRILRSLFRLGYAVNLQVKQPSEAMAEQQFTAPPVAQPA